EKTGKKIHTAIRYGVTQAILDAVAKSQHRLMAEVIADEYATGGVSKTPISIFTQSGDNRYENTDKMILKGSPILPHALINHVETKLGNNGEKLIEYVQWLAKRCKDLAPVNGYKPVFHIDVYGTIGLAFNNDWNKIVDYFAELEKAADGFELRIEGPVDMGERTAQMEALKKLTAMVDERGIKLEIVADEWCNTYEDIVYFADNKAGHMLQIKTPDLGGINNTVEAVIYCNKMGIGAYQGGTCNETNRSAEVCVNLAMATKPVQILAKPGMGVDEGFMIVYNEMNRIIAYMENK
ncbi:MAG: methylaspartate ammonia-lyase, partial [Oscillospiraceae bacterium]